MNFNIRFIFLLLLIPFIFFKRWDAIMQPSPVKGMSRIYRKWLVVS